jgi:hypothetical protein
MDRDTAILRINRGLGFLRPGHSQTNDIIQCLQEAQRDLEQGKTLPRFLLLEDQTITLNAGSRAVALPSDFLRADDGNQLYFIAPDSHLRHYLKQYRYYRDAVIAIESQQRPDQPAATTMVPAVYSIRQSTIDFVTIADNTYTMTWNYYRKDAILDSNIENLWLANADRWLIGEAGIRMAADKRDAGAVQLFTRMMQEGRKAVYADDLAFEDAAGPTAMGANL